MRLRYCAAAAAARSAACPADDSASSARSTAGHSAADSPFMSENAFFAFSAAKEVKATIEGGGNAGGCSVS